MRGPEPSPPPDYMGDSAPYYQRPLTYDEQQRMEYDDETTQRSIGGALDARNMRDYNSGQRGGPVGPQVGPVHSQYDMNFNMRSHQLSAQMNMLALPGEKHRVNNPPVYNEDRPVNTDPTTGGGTGEWMGGRGASRPLGSGLARRSGQPQQGQPRPPGQFKQVQVQPRHVLRQQALQRPMGKTSGKSARPMSKTTPSRVGTGGKRH